ncbi:MAG TPA: cyclopropane-fatty-acyl-phospholipid synthase family protein [Candidatus Sulfotelmatobacter sp.]|nr:cyclopropane-fatty-acyl-phospholipid synthase family protein [Candidatus Sulfotelmatobacter sp.]
MGLTANSESSQTAVQVWPNFLDTLLADYPKRNFQVRLWDGGTWGLDRGPRFALVLKHPGALREMFFSPSELTLGEAYIFDDLDIEGDIEAAFDLADYLLGQGSSLGFLQSPHLVSLLQKLPVSRQTRTAHQGAPLRGSLHSKNRDRQAIHYHYDLPPEFFALWLDRRMVYSCAYFASGEDADLDSAQYDKLDYICRKLRLRRGDRLLDIGCGWAGLVIHAALHYDAHALGITLSDRQAQLARRRIRDAGVEDRCRVEVCDYRDLVLGRQYDKIVSVGMFEHVGEALLPEYFGRAWQLLRPGGAFLNHGIAVPANQSPNGASFIDRYVFPDGELVPLNTSLRAAEGSGFEIRDVESLREHYALTLHHWVHGLEAHAEDARRITDETTYRTWRLYMAAAEHRFRRARLNLYQLLMVKPVHGESGMPLSRADWYRD